MLAIYTPCMPFVPKIRKIILKALAEQILPDLQQRVIPQVIAGPPFQFDGVPHWFSQKKNLRDMQPDPVQMAWVWKRQKLQAGRYPFIGFVYEGTLDNRIGIPESFARESQKITGKKPGGIVTVRLRAPAFIYFTPFVPGHNGTMPFYDAGHPGGGASKILWASVTDSEVRVHYCYSEPDSIFSSHPLQVQDPGISRMLRLYIEEKQCAASNSAAAQSLLFVMMNRLHRLLDSSGVTLGNSAWTASSVHLLPDGANKNRELCQKAMDYIEKCLHGDLDRNTIAKALNVSADHLGRTFLQVTGTSLMRYVTSRRVNAAKLMLAAGVENVNDISRLIGFASAASFCGSFKRLTGMSPTDYRRKAS